MKNKQIKEFFTKVAQDESFKAEVLKLKKEMEAKKLNEQDVQKFVKEKVLPKAKKLGYDFSEKDLADFGNSAEMANLTKLSLEDMENVSGGVNKGFLGAMFSLAMFMGVGAGAANFLPSLSAEHVAHAGDSDTESETEDHDNGGNGGGTSRASVGEVEVSVEQRLDEIIKNYVLDMGKLNDGVIEAYTKIDEDAFGENGIILLLNKKAGEFYTKAKEFRTKAEEFRTKAEEFPTKEEEFSEELVRTLINIQENLRFERKYLKTVLGCLRAWEFQCEEFKRSAIKDYLGEQIKCVSRYEKELNDLESATDISSEIKTQIEQQKEKMAAVRKENADNMKLINKREEPISLSVQEHNISLLLKTIQQYEEKLSSFQYDWDISSDIRDQIALQKQQAENMRCLVEKMNREVKTKVVLSSKKSECLTTRDKLDKQIRNSIRVNYDKELTNWRKMFMQQEAFFNEAQKNVRNEEEILNLKKSFCKNRIFFLKENNATRVEYIAFLKDYFTLTDNAETIRKNDLIAKLRTNDTYIGTVYNEELVIDDNLIQLKQKEVDKYAALIKSGQGDCQEQLQLKIKSLQSLRSLLLR